MSSACKIKFLLAAVLSLSITSVFATPPEWAQGRILVKGKAGLPDVALDKILNRANARAVSKLQQINTHIVEVPPQAEDAVIKALANNPHIDFAEKDMRVEPTDFLPNDPSYSSQWHLPKIQSPVAWDASIASGVTIAIVDSGVEASHPDLVNSLVPGWNVVSNNSDTSPATGHGTRVAGTAAATGNNSLGVASVAWGASIMPMRITNDGYAYWSDIAEAIMWAADHGANVANVSFGIGNSSTVTNAAQYMRNRGGVVLTSAGNSNTDNGYSDNSYIIHVAATTSSDAKASYSNYGNEIDVAAPGSGIYTATTGGGYTSASGTSHASPVAAGVVALIMGANPGLSPNEVEAILEDSADDLGSNGWDPVFGYGRVNAGVAIQLATGTSASDTQAPAVTISSPAYNSTVSGNVVVEVTASDNTGVTQVELYANGQSVGSDSTAPYQFSWDSAQVADGNATLTAYAYDAAGNTGISSGVTVNVDNQPENTDTTPPTVAIISPAASSNVISGTVNVSVNAADDTGVTHVVLYVNGQIAGTDSTAPYELNWDSTQVADGDVTFVAHAFDAASNEGASSAVVATVDNLPDVVDNTAPSVAITNPGNGSTVSGTVSINASASDESGVTQLSVYIDGSLKCSIADAGSLNCSWNTRKLSGPHNITARATDAAGNISQTSVSVSIASGSTKSNRGKGWNK